MIKHKFAVIIDIALKVQHVLIQFKVTNVLIQFKVTNVWPHEVDFKSRAIPTSNVNLMHRSFLFSNYEGKTKYTFMNKGRAKARRGNKGPNMRKAILNMATELTGRRCFMTVWVDSSHSCGRLLKNECNRATMLPETKA